MSAKSGEGNSGGKHLPIAKWLEVIKMEGYSTLFYQYNGVEDILHLNESDIKNMGVKNSAHRAQIVSSLHILREKFHKRWKPHAPAPYSSPPSSNRSTPNSTPPSLANHPDYACYAPVQASPQSPLSAGVYAAPGSIQPVREMMRYPWYHGNISRINAQSLFTKDGEFLVRDSTTNPGDYVLTCRHKGGMLHFMVNKQTVPDPMSGKHKIQYQFEEHLFDKVPQLISYYIDNHKPVTEVSGAILIYPINRSLSLDYGELRVSQIKLSPLLSKARTGSPLAKQSPHAGSAPGSPYSSPNQSPQLRRKLHRRADSQPLLSLDDSTEAGSSDSLAQDKTDCHGSLPTIGGQHSRGHSPASQSGTLAKPQGGHHIRSGSEPLLDDLPKRNAILASDSARLVNSAASDGDLTKRPPPKPRFLPASGLVSGERPTVEVRNKELYGDDGRDYSDYDQVKAWPAALAREAKMAVEHASQDWTPLDQDIPPPQDDYDEILDEDVLDDGPQDDYDEILDDGIEPINGVNLNNANLNAKAVNKEKVTPVVMRKPKPPNIYDVPKSNRTTSQKSIKSMRSSTVKGPKRELTLPKMDNVSLLDVDNYVSEILTPGNKPLEASAISTIKTLLVAVSSRTVAQHLTYLDLQILKVMGNHDFGLGVRSGLELITLPQGEQMRKDILERCNCLKLLIATSIVVCNSLAERAHMLDQWIRIASDLKSVCGNLLGFSVVMNALIMPMIKRLTKTWQALKHSHFQTHQMWEFKLKGELSDLQMVGCSVSMQSITIPYIMPLLLLYQHGIDNESSSVLPWESGDAGSWDQQMDVMFAHLDTARLITQQYGHYRVTAENTMQSFQMNRDLADVLKTEMHLRLLWGAKGIGVDAKERYNKFEQVLNVFSCKVEPLSVDKETSL